MENILNSFSGFELSKFRRRAGRGIEPAPRERSIILFAGSATRRNFGSYRSFVSSNDGNWSTHTEMADHCCDHVNHASVNSSIKWYCLCFKLPI